VRSLDTRVDSFMRAPAAAAMFVLADRLGLSAERLAAPATATALASTALGDLNPWTGQAAANRLGRWRWCSHCATWSPGS
jgi:hypothetical protein